MNPKPAFLFFAALPALLVPAHAAEDGAKYVSSAEAAKLVAPAKPHTLIGDDTFSLSLQERAVPSHVEKHMGWNEEIVIQEGDVRLNSGGTAVNAREISPGEYNGDSITGGTSVLMHPGDMAIIPAGTWHEEVIQTPTMRYILFKTRTKPAQNPAK